MMTKVTNPRIEVSIGTQTLSLCDGHRVVGTWPCSTSKFGIGFEEGSNKTPLGGFVVAEKFGEEAESGTIFKARKPVGHWSPGDPTEEDLILTRILRLRGLEKRNANTFDRYIYIHGTNEEHRMGRKGSHGCIRMANRDIMELFDRVPEGTTVWIEA